MVLGALDVVLGMKPGLASRKASALPDLPDVQSHRPHPLSELPLTHFGKGSEKIWTQA